MPSLKKEQLPRASLYDGGVTKQSNGARSNGETRKRVTELCSCILSDFGAISRNETENTSGFTLVFPIAPHL